jgi:O-antigen ligase
MIWKDVAYYIRQRPLLGCGYGGFWTPAHISKVSDEEPQIGGISSAHSAYIDYLLTLGVIGLVLYVFVISIGMWRAFRLYRRSQHPAFAFCGAILVFCALDGILDSDVTVPGTLLTFLWIVVLARVAYVDMQFDLLLR